MENRERGGEGSLERESLEKQRFVGQLRLRQLTGRVEPCIQHPQQLHLDAVGLGDIPTVEADGSRTSWNSVCRWSIRHLQCVQKNLVGSLPPQWPKRFKCAHMSAGMKNSTATFRSPFSSGAMGSWPTKMSSLAE